MKKILFLLIITLPVLVSAQRWQDPLLYGEMKNGVGAKRTMLFPTGCGNPSAYNAIDSAKKMGGFYFDSCNHRFWVYDPKTLVWDSAHLGVAGSGAIDTANKWVNLIERTPGKDSIIFWIGGTRYAIKDSTGGGGSTAWGSITGSITSQTDLRDSLLNKVSRDATYPNPSWVQNLDWSKIINWTATKAQFNTALSDGDFVFVSDTATMLSFYVREADSAAMLSNYFNTAGWGTIRTGQVLRVDSGLVTSRAWHQKGMDSLGALISSSVPLDGIWDWDGTKYAPYSSAGVSAKFNNTGTYPSIAGTQLNYEGYLYAYTIGVNGGNYIQKSRVAVSGSQDGSAQYPFISMQSYGSNGGASLDTSIIWAYKNSGAGHGGFSYSMIPVYIGSPSQHAGIYTTQEYIKVDNEQQKFTVHMTNTLFDKGVAKYNINYGSLYDARTLVDKNYVDSANAAGGGGYTTLAQFITETNWTTGYINGSGDYTALTVGAANTVYLGNGVTSAPSWGTVSNAALTNSTISGIALGSNLADLTIGTNLQLSSGTTYNGGTAKTISLQNAAADGATKGAASFTAAQFNDASGIISLDTTNGPMAGQFTTGYLTAANFNTLNKGTATYVVAASNSPTILKARADFICDGTADETEIESALALGNVTLVEGTYNITSSIDMPSNRTMSGTGDATILKGQFAHDATLNATSKLIVNSGNTGIVLKDFTIDGSIADTTGYGIYFELVGTGEGITSTVGALVENIYFKDIYQSGVEFQSCRNSVITKTKATGVKWDAIVLKKLASSPHGCINISVTNNASYGATAGVWAQQSKYVLIDNNIIEGDPSNGIGQIGIQVESFCSHFVISNNIVRNNVDNNISVSDGKFNSIIGNRVDSTSFEGIFLAQSDSSIIADNIVSRSGTYGINADAVHITISGNEVHSSSMSANSTYYGIIVTSADNSIINNKIWRGTQTNKSQYGIRTTAGASRVLIQGNNLYQSGNTGDINNSSTTSRIRNNIANDGTWKDLLYTAYELEMNTSRLLGRTTASQGKAEELTVSGILSLSAGNLSAIEVDGSTSNELQTLASTSDATSHTVTLSNSGGSVQLVEGSGITLTTTGTGLDGIITIASTASGYTTLSQFIDETAWRGFYANGSGDVTPQAFGADNTVWKSTGASAAPEWAKVRLNELDAADGSNTINNVNNLQEWQWNSLSAATGFKLSANTAGTGTVKLLELDLSGTGGTEANGLYVNVTKTATNNFGAKFYASGGTTNTGIEVGGTQYGGNFIATGGAGSISVYARVTAAGGTAIDADVNTSSGNDVNVQVTSQGASTTHTGVQIDVSGASGRNDALKITSGEFLLPEVAAPGTPTSGYVTIYQKTDGKLYSKNDAGTEYDLTAGGGSGDMVLASAQTNSGIKTFLDGTMKLRNVANTFDGYFVNTNTADRIYTLQNAAGTLAFLSDIPAAYTDEQAQDAVGAMVDASLTYVDGTPLLQRAALTGDVTASAGSNSTTIANDVVTYAKLQNVAANSFLANITGSSADVTAVATDRIPLFGSAITGTPSGTTFLRGDGTWATPGGAGTVTDFIFTDGSGFDGTVTTSTSTPTLSLTTRAASFLMVTGTDANITVAAGTAYHLPAATLTVGRNLDMTNVNANGDFVEFYNNETGFIFTFTGQTVYDSDGTTAVTELLVNTNSVVRRINGKLMISKL